MTTSKARQAVQKAKAAASRREALLKEAKAMFLIETSQLVGGQHCGSVGVLRELEIGEELGLIREPGNIHDEKAIRVDLDGFKLGYVAREHNDVASRMIDFGLSVRCFVVGRANNVHHAAQLVRIGLYLETV